MEWYELLIVISISFCAGFVVAGVLGGAKCNKLYYDVDFWRNACMQERDSHKGTQKLLDEYKMKVVI